MMNFPLIFLAFLANLDLNVLCHNEIDQYAPLHVVPSLVQPTEEERIAYNRRYANNGSRVVYTFKRLLDLCKAYHIRYIYIIFGIVAALVFHLVHKYIPFPGGFNYAPLALFLLGIFLSVLPLIRETWPEPKFVKDIKRYISKLFKKSGNVENS